MSFFSHNSVLLKHMKQSLTECAKPIYAIQMSTVLRFAGQTTVLKWSKRVTERVTLQCYLGLRPNSLRYQPALGGLGWGLWRRLGGPATMGCRPGALASALGWGWGPCLQSISSWASTEDVAGGGSVGATQEAGTLLGDWSIQNPALRV